MKALFAFLMIIGTGFSAFAGNNKYCTAYLNMYRSDNDADDAYREAANACYDAQRSAGVNRTSCSSPVYAGRSGHNNYMYRVTLSLTGSENRRDDACREAMRACQDLLYRYGGDRDHCTF